MKNSITIALAAAAISLSACTKETETPEPQNEPVVVTTPSFDCSTKLLCLQDDWKLDSVQYLDANLTLQMTGNPANGTVGLILNADMTASNGTLNGSWSYDANADFITTTNVAGPSGDPVVNSTQLQIMDTTNGTLGNTQWDQSLHYYSRR